jgi:hypothetical protein
MGARSVVQTPMLCSFFGPNHQQMVNIDVGFFLQQRCTHASSRVDLRTNPESIELVIAIGERTDLEVNKSHPQLEAPYIAAASFARIVKPSSALANVAASSIPPPEVATASNSHCSLATQVSLCSRGTAFPPVK